MWMSILAFLLLFLISVQEELIQAGASFGNMMKLGVAEEFHDSLYRNFLPSFSFVLETRGEGAQLADRQITAIMPLYGYTLEQKEQLLIADAVLSLEDVLKAEASEGHDGVWDETAGISDGTDSLYEAEGVTEGTAGKPTGSPAENIGDLLQQIGETDTGQTSLEELLLAENQAAALTGDGVRQSADIFVPNTIQAQINLEEMKNYETLVSNFYTIDANTMAGSDQLDVTKLLGADMSVSKEGEGPRILIYHTHSQEQFADSVSGDASTSIVGVGAYLAAILTEQYGYQVLHHTGQYDVEVRDDAYSKSLPAIEKVLEENPTIQVVIDLHRDEMPEEKKLVMDLQGRPTARFMFFNGLSRTRMTGDISYLYNENLQDNLAFSFQMQLKAAEYYPGLTRKIYLKGYRYNMHLKPRTLLVELGAQNNTVEEAKNACEPLAHILDMVLSGQ